jgi:hypothetical protein
MTAPETPTMAPPGPSRRGINLVWLSGGMLIMSLLIAAFTLSPMLAGKVMPAPTAVAQASPGVQLTDPQPALGWLARVDAGRWDDSWAATAAYFRANVTQARWAELSRAVRPPLGAVTSRKLLGIQNMTSLPNAPDGHYAILRFQSVFANKPEALETVTLVFEEGRWKVLGYFIR